MQSNYGTGGQVASGEFNSSKSLSVKEKVVTKTVTEKKELVVETKKATLVDRGVVAMELLNNMSNDVIGTSESKVTVPLQGGSDEQSISALEKHMESPPIGL